ncbi:otolith matrix protein OMM-64-like isoform X2 [Dendropsophus ebraccatus]
MGQSLILPTASGHGNLMARRPGTRTEDSEDDGPDFEWLMEVKYAPRVYRGNKYPLHQWRPSLYTIWEVDEEEDDEEDIILTPRTEDTEDTELDETKDTEEDKDDELDQDYDYPVHQRSPSLDTIVEVDEEEEQEDISATPRTEDTKEDNDNELDVTEDTEKDRDNELDGDYAYPIHQGSPSLDTILEVDEEEEEISATPRSSSRRTIMDRIRALFCCCCNIKDD